MAEAVVEPIAAPAGTDDRYQYFTNKTTGQKWKAAIDVRPARPPMLTQADIEAAPVEMSVAVTVSPIDDDGKALREDGKPIILDVHTHTFTHVEMAEENFDPINRVMRIIAERVYVGEARLAGIKAIRNVEGIWKKRAMIKSDPISYSNVAPEGQVLPGTVQIIGSSEGDAIIIPPEQPAGAVIPTETPATAEPAPAKAPPAGETGSEGVGVA